MKSFQLVLVFAIFIDLNLAALQEKLAWKEVEYAWESDAQKEEAVKSGLYIAENNLPLGLDVWKDKLFITVPRFKPGVASSLNYVKLTNDQNIVSPKLYPYPSWKVNMIDSNKSLADTSIISTLRTRIDECDRLWVMDTGSDDNDTQITPPALVIFDLNTDKLIRRYTLSPSDIKSNSFFGNVVVDISKNECDNAYAYLPDSKGNSIVVYSFKENKSWRVTHHYFHFDPLSADFNIAGAKFVWTYGVLGIALGKQDPNGIRTVYFRPLATSKEFSVPNYVLQNETRATSSDSHLDFSYVGDRGENGQSTIEFLDEKTNVLFYTQVNKDAVACWNVNKPYNPSTQGIVDSNSETLFFPNDLKVDRNGILWVLSDRLPAFLYKKLDPEQYNYRILVGHTTDVIKGTPCDPNYDDNKKNQM